MSSARNASSPISCCSVLAKSLDADPIICRTIQPTSTLAMRSWPVTRPSRSTVMKSPIRISSSSRCDARLQVSDNPEQHLDLRSAQCRCRFVENQNTSVLCNRLCDLDQLLLPDAEVFNRGARIDAGL